jgi:glycine betaine/choline ABC-type transport system substrate-binding protein
MKINELNDKRNIIYSIIKDLQEKPDTEEMRVLLYQVTLDLEKLYQISNTFRA